MEQLQEEKSEQLQGEALIKEDMKLRKKTFWIGFVSGLTMLFAVLALAVVVGIGTGYIHINGNTPTSSQNNSILTSDVIAKLDELTGQINLNYYEDVNTDDLVNGLYKGLLEGLNDPYSVYYTPSEYENMMISTTANYYGIGAGLAQDSDTMAVTITHVYDNSPAQGAGLLEGDKIVKVDDVEAASMELSDLVTRIRGEEGTSVHLEIYREGETDFLELDVERAKVDIPTVEYKLLGDHIGYIQVTEFAENTPTDFLNAITDLESQGMTKMIIDLRDNGGGLLNSCQQMLDTILPEGTVVYTEDKYGNRQDYTSDAAHYMDIPIVVLVNGNSASASEIFAGAIRDFDYGTLIGTNTFGKGIVQNIKQLSDGSAFKLTVSKYYTPSGDYIHGKGIAPDVELEYSYTGDTTGADYDEMQDNQVLKAIEELDGEE